MTDPAKPVSKTTTLKPELVEIVRKIRALRTITAQTGFLLRGIEAYVLQALASRLRSVSFPIRIISDAGNRIAP